MFLKAARQNKARQRVARPVAVPAPTGGWDAISPLANMPRDRAYTLQNWFPEPGYIRPRRGYVVHQNALAAAPVETLMTYNGLTSSKLFAACGGKIYDATSFLAGTESATGFSSSRWQYVNFSTSGGKFLVACNGVDGVRQFNGSTWSTPSITGSTAADFINVDAHKRRLWFTLKNSTKAAYLPVDSIAGAASEFDFGPVFTMGGFLVATGTWTIDGGTGVDDHFIAISSEGQVAVYAGTDPTSANLWNLVGVYNVGPPIGRKCLTKVAGDVAIISIDGVLPLSRALALDRSAAGQAAITSNIENAMSQAAQSYAANYGWQLIGYPKGTAAILNVPITEAQTTHQYVMNTLTGAWCKYTGQNAFCWELYEDRLFFGAAGGNVYEADVSDADDGAEIDTLCDTAFDGYGQAGANKRWVMVQPLFVTRGTVTPSIAVNIDFGSTAEPSPVVTTGSSGALWGTAKWNQFTWGGGTTVQANWYRVSGIGQYASIRVGAKFGVRSGASSRFGSLAFGVGRFSRNTSQGGTLQLNGFNVLVEPGRGI